MSWYGGGGDCAAARSAASNCSSGGARKKAPQAWHMVGRPASAASRVSDLPQLWHVTVRAIVSLSPLSDVSDQFQVALAAFDSAGRVLFEGSGGAVGEEDVIAAKVGVTESGGGEVVAVLLDEFIEDMGWEETFGGGLECVDGSPVAGVGGRFVVFESSPVAPDGDEVVVEREDGGLVGSGEVCEAFEASAVEDVAGGAAGLTGDVDGARVGGSEAFAGDLESEGEFFEGAVEALDEAFFVSGVGHSAWGEFADAGDFPDEVDAVLGAGVVGLVGLGEFDGLGSPAFGEEVVEEFGVGADDPESAAGGFGSAVDVIDAEDVDGFEMSGELGQGRRFEAVAHHVEVGGSSGGTDGVFVVGGSGEEFVIDERVGDAAVAAADAVVAGADDKVAGFMVGDDESLLVEVIVNGLGKLGELSFLSGGIVEGAVVGFDGVDAFDPAVEEDVGAEDVDFDAGVSGDLAEDFFAGAAGLPELEFFWWDVDGEGFLGEDADVFGAVVAASHFFDEGEFFEGGVEFAVDGTVEGEGVEGDILADAGPFDDDIERLGLVAGERAG